MESHVVFQAKTQAKLFFQLNGYRDLKPDNILGWTNPSDGKIVPKIADFGIARVLTPNTYSEYYASTPCGTPIYMAPETLMVG